MARPEPRVGWLVGRVTIPRPSYARTHGVPGLSLVTGTEAFRGVLAR